MSMRKRALGVIKTGFQKNHGCVFCKPLLDLFGNARSRIMNDTSNIV